MGKPIYFFGIESTIQKNGLLLSQRKYTLDLLQETSLFGYKLANTPMEADVKFQSEDSKVYDDIKQHKRMIGKFIYLIVIRPQFSFAIGLLSQLMHKSRELHQKATLKDSFIYEESSRKGLLYEKHGHIHVSAYLDAR